MLERFKFLSWHILALVPLFVFAAAPDPASARWQRPWPWHHAVSRQAMKLGDWWATIDTDRFSGEILCHLSDRRHGITYASGALGFAFGRHADTLNALIRIDEGQAIRWQDEQPELVRLGVPFDGASLDAPTDGIVWIPAEGLTEASRVAIQPGARLRPASYRLAGFNRILDAARQLGCAPDTHFLR